MEKISMGEEPPTLEYATTDILIVDDTPQNLRLLASILDSVGYHPRKVLSGELALSSIQVQKPDLVLLDIMMPGIDGFEVCQRLKSNAETQDIPIIFLSALSDGSDKARAFTMGGADYITKPFQVEEVLARIQNQIELLHARRRLLKANAELEHRVLLRTQELQTANARLQDMAYYDSLTGLANRSLFLQHLQEAIAQTQNMQHPQFSVLFIDCDRFKLVNDSLGHFIGDHLLIAIAQRLQAKLPHQSLLARLGGDEFAVLLPSTAPNQIVQTVQQLLSTFEQPFTVKDYQLFADASIGIALSQNSYQSPEQILQDADIAMYQAKNPGHEKYCFFDTSMHDQVLERLAMERDLRQALHNQELLLFYQPIIDIKSNKIHSFEVLIRWHSSHRGMVSPEIFIPIAEEIGLIYEVEHWVLTNACHQLKQWQDRQLVSPSVHININLSAHHFSQTTLPAEIHDILQTSQLPPHCLTLEITEGVMMANSGFNVKILETLRSQGIHISIDDFGTGYSSLGYLKHFPISDLKIDKSFIHGRANQVQDFGIVEAIIGIARGLGFNVTAEGIETPQQLACLKQLSCDYGQGYLWAKPQDAAGIEQWLITYQTQAPATLTGS